MSKIGTKILLGIGTIIVAFILVALEALIVTTILCVAGYLIGINITTNVALGVWLILLLISTYIKDIVKGVGCGKSK